MAPSSMTMRLEWLGAGRRASLGAIEHGDDRGCRSTGMKLQAEPFEGLERGLLGAREVEADLAVLVQPLPELDRRP